jgi:hypothetical protein
MHCLLAGGTTVETMDRGRIARDVGLIATLVVVGGLVVSMAFGGGRGALPMPHVALSNLLLGTLGFLLCGRRTPGFRGRHLFTVAALVWLLSVVNVPLLGITIGQWLASALAIFVACLVGGGLAALVFPARERAA